MLIDPRAPRAGVRKPPGKESAGERAAGISRRYGDLVGADSAAGVGRSRRWYRVQGQTGMTMAESSLMEWDLQAAEAALRVVDACFGSASTLPAMSQQHNRLVVTSETVVIGIMTYRS
jgi:hypothetical protein